MLQTAPARSPQDTRAQRLKELPFQTHPRLPYRIFTIDESATVRFDVLYNPKPGIAVPYAVQRTTIPPRSGNTPHAVVLAYGIDSEGAVVQSSETTFSSPGVISSRVNHEQITPEQQRQCDSILERIHGLLKKRLPQSPSRSK